MTETSFAARLRDTSVTAMATVIGATLAFIGVYVTGYFSYASKDEELKVHLIEVAFGILRADPKDKIEPARGWAIAIIEKNSGIPFSDSDKKALLSQPINSKAYALYDLDMIAAIKQGGYYVSPGAGRPKDSDGNETKPAPPAK